VKKKKEGKKAMVKKGRGVQLKAVLWMNTSAER